MAFGRLALRDYYPQLGDTERKDFVVAACWHMRDRFNQREVWERLGLQVDECLATSSTGPNRCDCSAAGSSAASCRRSNTSGSGDRRCKRRSRRWGAIEFARVDAAAQLENDARVAEEFDAGLRL